jgi:hypothetical protein
MRVIFLKLDRRQIAEESLGQAASTEEAARVEFVQRDRPLRATGPWLDGLFLRHDQSQLNLSDPTDVDRDHCYLVTAGRIRRQFA